ncbi:esterase E4-like isoform X1 [Rhynchophorus ferrugineus]|uniref:esterase E4-like isoform X1 n=2 Tax=Rhynchophorus ferrugineus TaxID=354439 RepID=UPI003FCC380B
MMSDVLVNIEEGKLRGITGKNHVGETIYEFHGIPYAKPPVNELRFRPPVLAEPWEGIKDATKPGEPSVALDLITLEQIGSEDCLSLNVYTKNLPGEGSEKKPVMVFIHGGALVVGSSRRQSYGPELLLLEDVVLVTLNYRLGLLGFLSVDDPSLGATGNAGLKDQSMALRWVQRNIKYFNGDPNNVTLFGESAGSGSVHAHILSPMSKGLFHKAILQSGCCLNSWFWGRKNNAREIVEAMGLQAETEAEAVRILRNAPVNDIFKAQNKFRDVLFECLVPLERRPFSAVIEVPNPEAFLSENPVDIIKKGTYNHVPIIFGYNDKEGLLIELEVLARNNIDSAARKLDLKCLIPFESDVDNDEDILQITRQLQPIYSSDSNSRQYDEYTDGNFMIGILESTRLHKLTTTAPIYLYRGSISTELNFLKRMMNKIDEPGCGHGDELGYLFRTELSPVIEPNSLEEQSMKNFVTLWTNFARFGDPTPDERLSIIWHPVDDADNLKLLNIDRILEYREVPEKERFTVWRKILEKWPLVKYH